MRMRRGRGSAVLVVVAVALTGCSSGDRAPKAAGPERTVLGSAARSFGSLSDLISSGKAVVRVRSTTERSVEWIGDVPFTVTSVDVMGVERGSVANAERVRVRQLGGTVGGVQVASNAVLLQPGTQYVLFVEPFSFGDGRDTGQWVILGPDLGMYELRGDRLLRPSSPDIPGGDGASAVPASLTLQQLRAELATS